MDDAPVIIADGFDDAMLGVGRQFNLNVAVYDYNKCVDVLMKRDKLSYVDAIEWMEFNVVGAYVGKTTPIFLMGPEYTRSAIEGTEDDD